MDLAGVFLEALNLIPFWPRRRQPQSTREARPDGWTPPEAEEIARVVRRSPRDADEEGPGEERPGWPDPRDARY